MYHVLPRVGKRDILSGMYFDRRQMAELPWRGILIGSVVGGTAGLLWALTRKAKISRSAVLDGYDAAFGDMIASEAIKDIGITEQGGDNRGARVEQMQRVTGNAPGDAWCASAVTTWIEQASRAFGVQRPIRGSAGVKELVQQMQDPRNPHVGWLGVEQLRYKPSLIRPGMLVMWNRSTYNSRLGHVGVVTQLLPSTDFVTVEGNSGAMSDRVSREVHRLDSPRLVGMGYFRNVSKSLATSGLGWTQDPPGVELF